MLWKFGVRTWGRKGSADLSKWEVGLMMLLEVEWIICGRKLEAGGIRRWNRGMRR